MTIKKKTAVASTQDVCFMCSVLKRTKKENHEGKKKNQNPVTVLTYLKKEGCRCGERWWRSVFILLLLLIIRRLLVGSLIHFLSVALSQLCSLLRKYEGVRWLKIECY